jgi:hypothetical protein
MAADAFGPLRRLLLALLAIGLLGVVVDLIMLAHYENGLMLIPFAVIAAALAALAARVVSPAAATVRFLRAAMALMFLTALVGVVLHYRGGVEFQRDMDPTLSQWALFWKVMHMKAPPLLAPGALLQLSLLGFAATYRDPLASSSSTFSGEES